MKPAVCIMGATASGKTDIAVALVKQGGYEIINVDSAQIYTDMNIGTAKPDAETLSYAPHRLLDFINPKDSYSVAQFCTDATREMHEIYANGNVPILAGGTMMYFNALQNGLSPLPHSKPELRETLNQRVVDEGLSVLYAELKAVDAVAANKIHANDTQRILRALEVYLLSGTPMSVLQQEAKPKSPFSFVNFVVQSEDRAVLHQRIALRFEKMLTAGLVEEVKQLFEQAGMHSDLPSMRCVGYRQVWEYLEGKMDYDSMKERGIIATRQLAKRQLTWLRSWEKLHAVRSVEDIINKY